MSLIDQGSQHFKQHKDGTPSLAHQLLAYLQHWQISHLIAIGLASAVFTYYLVKLLVKLFIDVRLADSAYRKFATNVATAVYAKTS